jgi:hypothetical protein
VDPFQSFSPLFFQPLTVNQCGPYNPSLPTQTELLSLLSSGPMTTILKMSNITDLFFNIKAIRFPETLGSAHKATHCHIPEEYKHKRSGVIILLRKWGMLARAWAYRSNEKSAYYHRLSLY